MFTSTADNQSLLRQQFLAMDARVSNKYPRVANVLHIESTNEENIVAPLDAQCTCCTELMGSSMPLHFISTWKEPISLAGSVEGWWLFCNCTMDNIWLGRLKLGYNQLFFTMLAMLSTSSSWNMFKMVSWLEVTSLAPGLTLWWGLADPGVDLSDLWWPSHFSLIAATNTSLPEGSSSQWLLSIGPRSLLA